MEQHTSSPVYTGRLLFVLSNLRLPESVLILFIFLLTMPRLIFSQQKQLQFDDVFKKVWTSDDYSFDSGCRIGCDSSDNLYVWDHGYKALWKISPSGEKLWRKTFLSENKDSSLKEVRGLGVSKSGKVCLSDLVTKTITILDSMGNLLSRFKVDMLPSETTFGDDESIYVTGFEFSYQGKLVFKYSIKGESLGSFCERDGSSSFTRRSGNSGRFSTDKDGNVYYAHVFPYKIEKFNSQGQLLQTFRREIADFKEPMPDETNMVRSTSGLKGLTFLNRSTMAVAVYINQKINNWGIDIFNTSGEWKGYIQPGNMPGQIYLRGWAADSKGFIYFLTDSHISDSYVKPIVIKYKIDLSKLEK